MLKALIFLLLCTTIVWSADICRKRVPLTPTTSCGPKQTMFNEGECLCCYYDTKNIPTIGIGFNLQRKDAAQVMSRYNLSLSSVLGDCAKKTTNYCLTRENAENLFTSTSYPEFESCVDSLVPNLPPVKRAAITDLAFAGCATLSKFVKMLSALKLKDWKTAANELKNSAWCTQVGLNRCNSDFNCIAGQSCTAQSCGTYTSCSNNKYCVCYRASNGTGVCLYAPNACSDYSDCTSCSPFTSVCVVDSCCITPKCLPLSGECNNNFSIDDYL